MARRRPQGVCLVQQPEEFATDVSKRLRYAGTATHAEIHRWVLDLDEHEWVAVLGGKLRVHVGTLPAHARVEIAFRDR